MGPPWLGPEKNFQNVDSQKPEQCYFNIGFANAINSSFNYPFLQLMNKYFKSLSSSKTAWLNDVVAQIYLSFLKFQQFGGVTPPQPPVQKEKVFKGN